MGTMLTLSIRTTITGETRSVKRDAFSRKAAAVYQPISAEHHQRQPVNEMSSTTSYDYTPLLTIQGEGDCFIAEVLAVQYI